MAVKRIAQNNDTRKVRYKQAIKTDRIISCFSMLTLPRLTRDKPQHGVKTVLTKSVKQQTRHEMISQLPVTTRIAIFAKSY